VWASRFARGLGLDDAGHALAADAAPREGLRVHYWREVPDEPAIPFAETLLHADDHLVVADKPHFLPVTPAGGQVRETLMARLSRKLGCEALVPLHRIDRDTAGLVLFSASAQSRAAYQALFRERRIAKRYEAIAPPLPQQGFPLTYRSRVLPEATGLRMAEVAGAPNSETRVEVLHRGAQLWHYALHPVTGRKHQLRVHMAALGAPIAGDVLYPVRRVRDAANPYAESLQLLAQSLAFDDPLTGEPRAFESRLKLQGPDALR